MVEKLENGLDSGAVSDKVKRQLFVNCFTICSAPECSERLLQNRTMLGDCAHIIPRKVGSHPREDYQTPLADRKEEYNLIYLCTKHHKIIDDKEHENTYTADVLREWKRNHEAWARGIKKNSLHLSDGIKNTLVNIEAQITEQKREGENIVRQLINSCRDFLHRNLLDEARMLLSQVDIILLDKNNPDLNKEADLLNAILSLRNEKIPKAKEQLLEIIHAHPENVEAMLEYAELCESVPELGDEVERVEKLARSLDSEHPRLLLIDLGRKYKKQEQIENQNIFEKQIDDVRLRARLISQHALFCNSNDDTEERDNLVNEWEEILPTSSRPHLFRALFKTSVVFRALDKDAKLLQEALKFSKEQRILADNKDPLTVSDKISWLVEDMKLTQTYIQISGADNSVVEMRDNLILLIGQCYFNAFIDRTLTVLLSTLKINITQWRLIKQKVEESKVNPSSELLELLFLQALQYSELENDLRGFVPNDLLQVLQAIKSGDVQEAASCINAKNNPTFSLLLLSFIVNNEIAPSLSKSLKIEPTQEQNLLFAQLNIFNAHNQDEEVLNLVPKLNIKEADPLVFHLIEKIAFRKERWDIFINHAVEFLRFEGIPEKYKVGLQVRLAIAYEAQGDDTNAITHAEQALKQHGELEEINAQNALIVLGNAFGRKGLFNEACEKFEQYQNIKRTFGLFLQEAELNLRSSAMDKDEKALVLIVKAFEEADTYQDEMYLSVMMLLVEITNAEKISTLDEEAIKDEMFIKLDRFTNGWFYLGRKAKSLGAQCIEQGTDNYKAVINKTITEDIEWPADKFSTPKTKRKILHICKAPAFLSWRAHEVVRDIADLGTKPIWSINAVKEDGNLDTENIIKFHEEKFSYNKSFEIYVKSRIPFSLLCKAQGGLHEALGKLSAEKRGFIYCNDGTQADISAQLNTANNVLEGALCFIDGLSAFMLAEAELLKKVVEALPNLGVSTSVIKLLREIAAKFNATSGDGGRVSITGQEIQFSPQDREKEQALRERFLEAADLLDQLPNKKLMKTYPAKEGVDLDNLLLNYFVDAFRYAQEEGAYILTDDPLFVQAYQSMNESPVPNTLSSLSLVRAMVERENIAWEDYLKYFNLLSSHRYNFLPISCDDMMRAAFPSTENGLITPMPDNISFFNLQFTLSQEYGATAETAARFISSFFIKLIEDDAITPEIAKDIFIFTIMVGLVKRDKRLIGGIIFKICEQNIHQKGMWASEMSKRKLRVLYQEIFRFTQDFDPTIGRIPLLLKTISSRLV